MGRSANVRRICAFLFVLWSALLAAQARVLGEEWPSHPVRIIVPFPAGQGADLIGRLVAEPLSIAFGQPFIVENRPGAGSLIGTAYAAKASPDGYTLLIGGTSAMVVSPFLYKSPGYDTLRDFAPITGIASLPMVYVVNTSLPFRSIQDLIRYAKDNPGKIKYGSSGNGSSHHLVQAMFARGANIELTHIPYKGTVAGMTDLMGGHIDMLADTLPAVAPFVKAGTVRALAISSAKRSPYLPTVPTLGEQAVPGFDATAWSGLFAPKGTPDAILERLSAETIKAFNTTEMRERVNTLSLTVVASSRQEFEAFVGSELQRWRMEVKASGAKLD